MARKHVKLQKIENNCEITCYTDDMFLCQLQRGLLLALKEKGLLTAMQYRFAAETLSRQHKTLSNRIRNCT